MRRDGVILNRRRSASAVVDRMVLQDLALLDQLLVCRQFLRRDLSRPEVNALDERFNVRIHSHPHPSARRL